MFRLILLAASIMCCFPAPALATPCWAEKAKVDSPAAYSHAFVMALVYVNLGLKSLASATPTHGTPEQFMTAMMAAQHEFECAARIVNAYRKSKSARSLAPDMLRRSAQGVWDVSTGLSGFTKGAADKLRRTLDGEASKAAGSEAEHEAYLATRSKEGLEMLPMFSTALVHGLLQRPVESKRLVLTRAERGDLLGLVEKLFGSELAEGQDAVTSYPTQAAQILKQFLSDKWLSADSPDSDIPGP